MSQTLLPLLRSALGLPEAASIGLRLLDPAPTPSSTVAQAFRATIGGPRLDPGTVTAILEDTLPFSLGRFDEEPAVFAILEAELCLLGPAPAPLLRLPIPGGALIALDSRDQPVFLDLGAGRALVLHSGEVFEAALPAPSASRCPAVTALLQDDGGRWVGDAWLQTPLQALRPDDDEVSSITAAGLLLRLWRPRRPEARLEARALLRCARLPPPQHAARDWLRTLPTEHLNRAEEVASRESARLYGLVESTALACTTGEEGAAEQVRELVQGRERLASLLVALKVAGRRGPESRVQGLDDLALTALEALHLALPDWTNDEEAQLREAAISDPQAWWATLRRV